MKPTANTAKKTINRTFIPEPARPMVAKMLTNSMLIIANRVRSAGASAYPDAFLRRGVDVLGGVRVTAPDAFLNELAEGGSGYHFFGRSAEKVVLVRKSQAMASCAV